MVKSTGWDEVRRGVSVKKEKEECRETMTGWETVECREYIGHDRGRRRVGGEGQEGDKVNQRAKARKGDAVVQHMMDCGRERWCRVAKGIRGTI